MCAKFSINFDFSLFLIFFIHFFFVRSTMIREKIWSVIHLVIINNWPSAETRRYAWYANTATTKLCSISQRTGEDEPRTNWWITRKDFGPISNTALWTRARKYGLFGTLYFIAERYTRLLVSFQVASVAPAALWTRVSLDFQAAAQ